MKSNSTGYADQDSYYIKRKYYTPENIEEGQQFFELNCAVCHGKEGDGTGLRAEAMSEAKPRMLIDTDWLATQDDLNLLRAIKYGVPGTAMVPWGDQSSVLQRLQLVIFIRSLSQESMVRDQLQSILYKTFDVAKHAVDVARSNDYIKINDTQKKLKVAKQEQESLKDLFKNGKAETAQLVQVYQQILELQKQLQTYQEEDQQYVKLNDLIEKEKMGLFELGRDLVESSNYGLDTAGYFKMVSLSENRIKAKGPQLVLANDPKNEQEFYSIGQSFIDELSKKLKELKEKNALLSGKIASPTIQQQIDDSTVEIAKLEKLKDKFISTLADTKRFREDEKKTIENLDKNKS